MHGSMVNHGQPWSYTMVDHGKVYHGHTMVDHGKLCRNHALKTIGM